MHVQGTHVRQGEPEHAGPGLQSSDCVGPTGWSVSISLHQAALLKGTLWGKAEKRGP